jgi:hypothetical protein
LKHYGAVFSNRSHVTRRIISKEDIENVLAVIECAYGDGELEQYHYLNYRAITLFRATYGQRSYATLARLTIGHFKEALNRDKPLLDIPPKCDKIRMQHYCPLHPHVVEAIQPLLSDGQSDDEYIFKQLSFERWLKERKILLIHSNAIFKLGDARKFCEQMSDILQGDHSNKNYVLTYRVSGVIWQYKHPPSENVYDVYLRYWRDVRFEGS